MLDYLQFQNRLSIFQTDAGNPQNFKGGMDSMIIYCEYCKFYFNTNGLAVLYTVCKKSFEIMSEFKNDLSTKQNT